MARPAVPSSRAVFVSTRCGFTDSIQREQTRGAVMTELSLPIDYFKKSAKILCKQVKAAASAACQRARVVFNDYSDKSDDAIASAFTLMRAQHVVAVEHDFA